MPKPQHDWNELVVNPLVAEQLNYDRNMLCTNLDARLPHLNGDQRHAFTCIVNSVTNDVGKLFFLNGPGGTGKTFVYNTVCAKLRSEGTIVLCVSSSGISALLLQGG
jgi:superfamily II DNA or RNA helicase